MTGIANHSAGMLLRIHLREPLRFGGAGFMALRAQHGRVRQSRHDGDRVLCMLGLRAMASLASDSGMFALGLHLQDIGVAGFAGLVPGVDDGQRRNFRDGVAAVMSDIPQSCAVRKRLEGPGTPMSPSQRRLRCGAGVRRPSRPLRGNFRSSFAAQLGTVSSMKLHQSLSRKGAGSAPLREITQLG